MNLLEQAYQELYPERKESRDLILSYSGRFRGYNANIRMNWGSITINASKKWKVVSSDIQKGLYQELLVRLLKVRKNSINIDLYHNFIKSLSNVAPKTQTHPVLEQSFQRVNEQFFNGMLAQPNLKIGSGVNRLGTYEYATDTVMLSRILLENEELMDYVMYHELLHKKHQYSAKSGRQLHHGKKFRDAERMFPDAEKLELELNKLVRKHKRVGWFW
ncbi:SprT-like family protein [uncultured archaeon]|nr:SprT-like family protein [uncultured archaeon]